VEKIFAIPGLGSYAIEAVGAKVLGVVLNGINTKGSYKKYYGNHYTSSGSAK